ncbi:C-type lectin domain-containing protein [Lachnospiraceae bacterium C1.1]|nr:C-type lectin domain-containing protein [Lachnospiraceae bacterium C1.1]
MNKDPIISKKYIPVICVAVALFALAIGTTVFLIKNLLTKKSFFGTVHSFEVSKEDGVESISAEEISPDEAIENIIGKDIETETAENIDKLFEKRTDYYRGGFNYETLYEHEFNSWQEAYLAYIEHWMKYSMVSEYDYMLIYVDDNDIPELAFVSYGMPPSVILSYNDGKLTEFNTERGGFSYIEKSGLLCNSDGISGVSYDYVYILKDGKWEFIFDGEQHYSETVNPEEIEYLIDNEEVDEQTYDSKFKEVYDYNKRTDFKEQSIDEIISYIKTNKMISADHKYELFIEDCTWEEAAKKCDEKGGYLASMTCDEEFEVVDELIRTEGKQNYCFYIGAKRGGEKPYVYWWIEPGLVQRGLDYSIYENRHWLDGEPSYKSELDDGREIEEDHVEYIHIKSKDKFYMNDIPNDVIAYYPSFRGRMGYICEYSIE